MPNTDGRFCRVCGYEPPDPPWGMDGNSPTFVFCSCCGVEWGYGDATPKAIMAHRARWLSEGALWYEPDMNDALSVGSRLERAVHAN